MTITISPYTVGLYCIPIVILFYLPAITKAVKTITKNLAGSVLTIILMHMLGVSVALTPLFLFESAIAGPYSLIPLVLFYGMGYYAHPFTV